MKIGLLDKVDSIASSAALELDNLSLRRNDNFECVDHIKDWLTEKLCGPDPDKRVTVAVWYAMINAGQYDRDDGKLRKLIKAVVPVRDRLLAVSTYPATFAEYRGDDLEKLKSFCLELSKTAEEYDL